MLLGCGTLRAQSWKEALKSAATTAADRLTDGQATQRLMVGSWNYASPGVKLESDNVLASAGALAAEGKLEARLESLYTLAGIRAGACSVVFGEEGDFTLRIGTRDFSGTYTYEGATHEVTLRFEAERLKRDDVGGFTGRAYADGGDLQLLFPATRLLKLVEGVGEKLSLLGGSLASVSALAGQFDGLYVGFTFNKSE